MRLFRRSAVLFLTIFVLSSMTGCGGRVSSPPKAVKGVIDLRNWDFGRDGSVPLRGEWEFHWNRFLSVPAEADRLPPDLLIDVPRPWNKYNLHGNKLPATGHASYRLRVLLPSDPSVRGELHLMISNVYAAYECSVNGVPVMRRGTFSSDGRDFRGDMTPVIFLAGGTSDSIDLIMNVSNHFFSMSGGITDPPVLGLSGELISSTQRSLVFYMFCFGIYFIMALYHFFLWLHKREDRYFLIFSAVCMIMAIQSVFVSEKNIANIFLGIELRTYYQIWYLVFLIFPLAVIFYREIFPDEIARWVVRVSSVLFAVCILFDFILPAERFTALAPFFYFAGIMILGYIIRANLLAIIRRRELAVPFLLSLVIPVATGVNDILFSVGLVDTGFVSPQGFLVFMVFQSYLMSLKFIRSFRQVEILTSRLSKVNRALEKTVAKRTFSLKRAMLKLRERNREISIKNKAVQDAYAALEKSNRKLRSLASCDALTGISNRRSFFEMFDMEWKRAIRHKYPVSVVFIDVDYFKKYNDTYGHLAGDRALRKIGAVLAGAAKRPTDFPARYGGEEFILFLGNTGVDGAMIVAESIIRAVASLRIPHRNSKAAEFISVSVGVACSVPSGKENLHSVIKKADTALYRAKKNGRNRVERV